jgi:hypothetical protein
VVILLDQIVRLARLDVLVNHPDFRKEALPMGYPREKPKVVKSPVSDNVKDLSTFCNASL